VVKNKVIVGTSGGDDGVRGFVAAYDVETGKEAWRFWTIPGPGEFGSSSWPGESYKLGGGTTWMPGTFDPELNTIFWGTSNPAPDFDGGPRPGDDLYTDCLLALDPDNGKLKWYFQFTPHDLFDYDAVETPVLVDTTFRGQPRNLVIEANRNGFLYVLDRTNGAFLQATRFAEKLNWATGIDEKGRPIRTEVKPTEGGTRVCPGMVGATNWYSPAFNPDTSTLYFMALESCDMYLLKPREFRPGQTYYSTGVRHSEGDFNQKILLAYALESDKPSWRYVQAGEGHSAGGVLTTASGLVFFGDDAHSFEAVDAQGKPLWHFNTGQTIVASPMSYAVNAKQYVAIAAGSDVFSFTLP
jgi:alcohol dehydrogenase (cytochrome c)